jgi:hypothetical protein
MRWLHDISSVLPTNGEPDTRDVAGIDSIVIHCTAMPEWNVWDVARYHTGPNHISLDGCPTIGYAYFVEPDGLLYKCLRHEIRSWHVGPWNDRAVGICLAYEAGEAPPSGVQLAAAVDLAARLVIELDLSPRRVFGHRELEGTGSVAEGGHMVQRKECPGVAIDMDRFRRIVGEVLDRPEGPDVADAAERTGRPEVHAA